MPGHGPLWPRSIQAIMCIERALIIEKIADLGQQFEKKGHAFFNMIGRIPLVNVSF